MCWLPQHGASVYFIAMVAQIQESHFAVMKRPFFSAKFEITDGYDYSYMSKAVAHMTKPFLNHNTPPHKFIAYRAPSKPGQNSIIFFFELKWNFILTFHSHTVRWPTKIWSCHQMLYSVIFIFKIVKASISWMEDLYQISEPVTCLEHNAAKLKMHRGRGHTLDRTRDNAGAPSLQLYHVLSRATLTSIEWKWG